MSVAQMQVQLEAVLTQLQSLQREYATMQGSLPYALTSTTWCYSFMSNLAVGSTGADVQALQSVLAKLGERVTMSGAFDDQTASAVTGFQERYAAQILMPYGLQHGTGYVGRSTRARLNKLFGCGQINPNPNLLPSAPSSPRPFSPPAQASTTLPVTANPAFNSGTIDSGMINQRIGSYIVTNPSSQTLAVNSLTIGSGLNGSIFQNMKVLIGNTQFGTAQPSVQSGAYYTFSGGAAAPLLPPEGNLTLDVYADTISTDQVGSSDATSFGGCAAGVWLANGGYSCASAIGKTMTIAAQSLLPIQINQPQNGGQWTIGQSVPIQWAAAIPWNGSGNASSVDQGSFTITLLGTGSNFPIAIASGSTSNFLISEGDIYSHFAYSYVILGNTVPGQYSLTVTQLLGSASTSDTQPIAIAGGPQGLAAIAPAGGEQLFQAQQFAIRWSAPPSVQTVSLNLLQNGNFLYEIANGVANTGSYLWTIPQDNNAGLGFQIHFAATGSSSVTSNFFSITKTKG